MKEINIEVNLGKVIKDSKKKISGTKRDEGIIDANYILESFAQNELSQEGIVATKDDLQNAISKTVETAKTKVKKVDGTTVSRRKVVKQYYMTTKEKLEIIRQVTECICKNGKKQFIRNTYALELQDMIREGILTETGSLNKKNGIVKKLLPETRKIRRTAK